MALQCFTGLDGQGNTCFKGNTLTMASGLYFTSVDYSIDTAANLVSESNWNTEIAAKNIIPWTGIKNVEVLSVEDGASASQTGEYSKSFEAVRRYGFDFELSLSDHKIARTYSKRRMRVIIVDKNGNVITTSSNGTTNFKGFLINNIEVHKLMDAAPDAKRLTRFDIELQVVDELDANGWIVDLTFAQGLIGITKTTTSSGAVAAFAFSTTVTWTSNSNLNASDGTKKSSVVSGLLAANFQVTDQSGSILTNVSIVESTASPGTYTVTDDDSGLTSGSLQIVATSANLYESVSETLSA